MKRLRALSVLAALAVACSPITSKESDRKTGVQMSEEVKTKIGLYPTPAKEWVEAVGKRLVHHLSPDNQRDWDFSFDVVDQLEPNAFALPGGPIYVSRGLLALVVDEDDLAGVLGHEISHVTERHSARRAERAILPGILTLPGRVVGIVSEDLGAVVAAPFAIAGQIGLARYSRGQEADADRMGVELAARSGYDPRALARILERLEKDATRLAGKEHRSSFFDDHPDTPTRVKDLYKESGEVAWLKAPPLRSQPLVVATLDGLVWGTDPAQGVFRGPLFLHPDLGFAVRFPDGWRTVNGASAVGATRERDAVVAVSATGADVDPQAAGKELSRRLRREDIVPDEERPVVVNGNPGYYLHVSSRKADISILWVAIGSVTYDAVGLGDRTDRPAITSSLYSMRGITEDERRSIEVVRLHPARALRGERLAELGDRTGNFWSTEYTAMVNALPAGAVLDDGAAVKIARRELYVAPSGAGRP
jgi:predicted Zn-dependent protease